MRVHAWMATGVMALAGAGCFYPAERGKILESRIEELTQKNQQLSDKLAETAPIIDAKITEVSKALEGLDKAARRSDADIGVQLQKTLDDVAKLHGELETYAFRISELEAGL